MAESDALAVRAEDEFGVDIAASRAGDRAKVPGAFLDIVGGAREA